jgi:hypothetical protein
MTWVGLGAPRLLLLLIWAGSGFLERAYETFIWPALGFFFLPTTTLSVAFARNEMHGVRGWGLALVVVSVIIDLESADRARKLRGRAA